MTEVSWKVDIFKGADARKCYEEIGDTQITPQEILEKARDKKSELHKCFEWDDTKAAEKYRLIQARSILLNLVITTKPESEPIRVYQITSEKNVYQPTKLFLKNPTEYQELLNRALGELHSIQKRYSQLAELESVFEAIDSL